MDGVFGERLRTLRLRAGMTQAELAARAGLGRRTVNRLESGDSPSPQAATLRLLAKALRLDGPSAEWLRTGEGSFTGLAPGSPLGPAGPLIGRDAVLRVISRILGDPETRLLTLTGPGGVGKTSLAKETARAWPAVAEDGALVDMVPLAEVSDPADILPAIARTLGFHGREGGVRPLLARTLAGSPMLLVLDNLEHLPGAAQEIEWLLNAAPRLIVLATSREALRLQRERVLVVDPLPLDSPDSPAVTLFVERARRVRFGFAPSPAERQVIRDLCERLGGLPLAIELAASQMDTLTPAAVLALLEQAGVRALPPNAPGSPSHLASMVDVIDWSWRLLDPGQQRLMRAAAVFAGGFTPAAIENVVASAHGLDAAAAEAAPLLPALLRAHLLRQQPPWPDERTPRFAILEPIRDYALDRLRESGEEARVRLAHAAWTADRLEQTDRMVMSPGRRMAGMDRMEREYPNGSAALRWALAAGERDLASRLVVSLRGAWGYTEHADRLGSLESAVADLDALSPVARQWAAAAWLDALGRAGDAPRIRAGLAETIARARAYGDPVLEAMATLHWSRDFDEDPVAALASVDRALALLGDEGDTVDPPYLQSWALVRQGVELHRMGRLAEALPLMERGLAGTMLESGGIGAATQHGHLGLLLLDLGQPRRAAETMLTGLWQAVRAEDRWAMFQGGRWLARVVRAHGGPPAATILAGLDRALAAEHLRSGQPLDQGDILAAAGDAPPETLEEAITAAAALPGLLPERVEPEPGARFTGRRLE
ncbi:MAG: ATP-binding protein [Chloroflexota bacterium]